MGFATDAIHAGQSPDSATGAVMTPIYMTSTYAQDELGKHKGYEYGRTHNPTREALEKNIAALERGKYGIAFASGVAAIQALQGLVKSGDHIIASDNVYGGTYRLFEKIWRDYNINFSWIDMSNPDNIINEIIADTRLVYIETPTNPMLNLTDIKRVSEIAKNAGLFTVVDNTFMTPYFQRPLELGADIVLHSSTKYLNGHSDVIGGIIVTRKEDIHEKIRFIQKAAGAVPSPFDCWLTLRATKTLAIRMKQHNENAMKIAGYLQNQSYVKSIYYPGLKTHPHHELALKQMSGFGGIVSIDFGDAELAEKFLRSTKVFTLAESLGGVESLLCHPATMTHASVPKRERERMGITESLVRLSVGIEDVEDLIADIEQAVNL
ncbi:MAG: cystathionine gamma-synthase [Melioribacteraceae bacterium]|nr:cystathionine gamma-synthase [Melioribacteraceae bacterium]